MRIVVVLLALGLAAIEAVPRDSQRIVGGTEASILDYPYMVALLYSSDAISYRQACAGIIIVSRSVLTAAHCVRGDPVFRWRVRVGSSLANSGGVIHIADRIVTHASFGSPVPSNNDIAVVGTATAFTFNNFVRAGAFAGPTYSLRDDEQVWAAGWGVTSLGGSKPEQLRQVRLVTVNQELCRDSYASFGTITENMLCAGFMLFGGFGTCEGDSGGSLVHSGTIVGVTSWGRGCAMRQFPPVFTRVSSYSNWIINNA